MRQSRGAVRVSAYVRLSAAVAGLAFQAAAPLDAVAHGPAHALGAALGGRFVQVGHHALGGRALNSGLALGARYAYIGNEGGRPIAILSIRRPDRLRTVGQLRQPAGETPEGLRLWPRRDVLSVVTYGCRQPTCPQGVPLRGPSACTTWAGATRALRDCSSRTGS
jgi:hypothetical protein